MTWLACNVTLGGSLNRSIPKQFGASAGTLTTDSASNCTSFLGTDAGYTLDVLLGGGMPILYLTFIGSLPTPTGISTYIDDFAVLIDLGTLTPDLTCLYSAAFPLVLNISSSATSLNDPFALTTDLSGRGVCPASTDLTGSLSIAPSQTLILVN
jgi:hypothetical protein